MDRLTAAAPLVPSPDEALPALLVGGNPGGSVPGSELGDAPDEFEFLLGLIGVAEFLTASEPPVSSPATNPIPGGAGGNPAGSVPGPVPGPAFGGGGAGEVEFDGC